MTESNFAHYHGGSAYDEFAAFASLLLGARIAAGPVTREFGIDDDPLGRPRAFGGANEPYLPPSRGDPVLPGFGDHRSLNRLCLLRDILEAPQERIVPMTKAARLYQQAVWLAESSPNMSWLLLVSALEVAAAHWDQAKVSSVERFSLSYERLAKRLKDEGGAKLVKFAASELHGLFGSTGKFVRFLSAFSPGPPNARPKFSRFDFRRANIKRAAKVIYKHRSKALHSGISFPAPMCEPPRRFSDSEGFTEVPLGLASHTMNATWLLDDTPCMLHTFEHVTRGCLMKWMGISEAAQ